LPQKHARKSLLKNRLNQSALRFRLDAIDAYLTGDPPSLTAADWRLVWLWQWIQNCRKVVTLGTIAEYGVLPPAL